MLYVQDILGNDGRLSAVQGFTHEIELNGDDFISGDVPFLESQAEGFAALKEESIITFEGAEYVVIELNDIGVGLNTSKSFVGIRKVFNDLNANYVYETTSGAKSLAVLMDFILDDTSYTYTVVDSFDSQVWENFGDDWSSALFQSLLDRYGAEYELNGTQIILRQSIGNVTDFQFRYGYNIKALNIKVDTSNLTTYVKGFGKELEGGGYTVQGEYFSPNISLYGTRHAKPVRDDRVTTIDTLNKLMQAAVSDVPIISIDIDFVDLRAAGYPNESAELGDTVLLIYEPMENLQLDTRLTKVVTEYDTYLQPISTKVTLANIRKDITDTLASFSGTSKTVKKVFNEEGGLSASVIPQDVRDATDAVTEAQSELQFLNGIRGTDTANPLLRVVWTSAGIGVSNDGGVSYTAAVTGDGINLEALSGSIDIADVPDLQASLDGLDGRLDTLEGYDVDTRLNTLEGYDLDTRVTTLEGYDADTRLTALEDENDVRLDSARGTTVERPTLLATDDGFMYYDRDLLKVILWNGTAWVNVDGTTL